MTTTHDRGGAPVTMLRCPLRASGLHPTLVLALRDMRRANGRDEETGRGEGNAWWAGWALGMVVLDTLAGDTSGGRVQELFEQLLKDHGIEPDDARTIYRLRCSILHGYGLPTTGQLGGRRAIITDERHAVALDSDVKGRIVVSIPVFCAHLVERIAFEAPANWDATQIDTQYPYPESRQR